MIPFSGGGGDIEFITYTAVNVAGISPQDTGKATVYSNGELYTTGNTTTETSEIVSHCDFISSIVNHLDSLAWFFSEYTLAKNGYYLPIWSTNDLQATSASPIPVYHNSGDTINSYNHSGNSYPNAIIYLGETDPTA